MLLLALTVASLFFLGIPYIYIRKWTNKDWEGLILLVFDTPIGYYMMRPTTNLPPPFVDVTDDCIKAFEGGIKVIPVPVRDDNYAYLILDLQDEYYCAIDPSDPQRVLDVLQKEAPGAVLNAALVTHKHWDHTAGNAYLRKAVKGIMIWGPAEDCRNNWIGTDPWLQVNIRVDAGRDVTVGRLRFKTIAAPCHTRGSVMYFLDPSACPSRNQTTPAKGDSNPMLFTGDTIFVGGCGKFFEGAPKDMHEIIYTTISTIPKNTYVYPGHEYAYSNLAFAKSLEPSNATVEKAFLDAKERKASRRPNVPSLLQDEYEYNPFFRVKVPELSKKALAHANMNGWLEQPEMREEIGLPADKLARNMKETGAVILGIVRAMKNQFRAS